MRRPPGVLFLCVHNAGRSQMGAGWLRHLAGDRIRVLSAGSAPSEAMNPTAVEAMAEAGVDISSNRPQLWTEAMVRDVDVVVSMGCGDECPVYPGTRRLDWQLEDPTGQGVEIVRGVRDEIRTLVGELLEVEVALIISNEFGPPVHQVVDHLDDVAGPGSGQIGIDQFTAVLKDFLQVKLRAVAFSHGRREAAAGDCRRAAGGPPLGHLDDVNTSLGTFESGHGARCAATNNQDIRLTLFDREVEIHGVIFSSYRETHRHRRRRRAVH